MDGRGDGAGGEELDEREGVAVVFDKEDEDEDEAAEFEVRDGDSTDDEEMDDASDTEKPTEEAAEGAESEDELIIGGTKDRGKDARKQAVDKDIVPAHDIDAYWLQRQVSAKYPDPHLASSKATKVLEILAPRLRGLFARLRTSLSRSSTMSISSLSKCS